MTRKVPAVANRGSSKEGVFGIFLQVATSRFLHQAGSTGNPELEDFFTEEYALNHLIFTYPSRMPSNGRHCHGRWHGHQPKVPACAS